MRSEEGRVMGKRRPFQFGNSTPSALAREAKLDSRSGKQTHWTKDELEHAIATHSKLKGMTRTREIILAVLGRDTLPRYSELHRFAFGPIIASLCYDMIDRRNLGPLVRLAPPREEA